MIPISLQPIIISIETANRTKVLLKKRYKLRKWIAGKFNIKLSKVLFINCWICGKQLSIIDRSSISKQRDIFGIGLSSQSHYSFVCDIH